MNDQEQTLEDQPDIVLRHPSLPRLKDRFPDTGLKWSEFRDQTTIAVPLEHLHEVMDFLRNDPENDYDFLADVTAVDYLDYPAATLGRFAIVYILKSYTHDFQLTVKTYIDPSIDTSGNEADPALEIDSVTDLWAGAEWPEREVFDMFGIRFRNHPDLRRILTFDDFPAHPLRKDYPLHGRNERENFATIEREDA